MGWETSNRKASLPSNWPSIRLDILRRDKYRCQWVLADGGKCRKKATDVDHIERNNDHRYSNLRGLCSFHHNKKSSAEGSNAYWSAVNKSKQKFRHDDVHPAFRQRRGG